MAGWSAEFDWTSVDNMKNAPVRCILDLYAAAAERGASMPSTLEENQLNSVRVRAAYVHEGVTDLLENSFWYDKPQGVPTAPGNEEKDAEQFLITEEIISEEAGFGRPTVLENGAITAEWVVWHYVALNSMIWTVSGMGIIPSSPNHDIEKREHEVLDDPDCVAVFTSEWGGIGYIDEPLGGFYPFASQSEGHFFGNPDFNDCSGYRDRPVSGETFPGPARHGGVPIPTVDTYFWWGQAKVPGEGEPGELPDSMLGITGTLEEWNFIHQYTDIDTDEIEWNRDIMPDTAPVGPFGETRNLESWIVFSKYGMAIGNLETVFDYYDS